MGKCARSPCISIRRPCPSIFIQIFSTCQNRTARSPPPPSYRSIVLRNFVMSLQTRRAYQPLRSISAYCNTAEPSCGGPESASWLAFLFPPKTGRNRSRAGCVIRCTREGPSTASLLFPASGSSGWPLPEKRFDFFPFFRRSIGGGGALLTFPALGASFPH